MTDLFVQDLEPCKQRCQLSCTGSSVTPANISDQHCTPRPLLLSLQGALWYRPTDLQTVYKLLGQFEPEKVKLLVGNTGGVIVKL